HVYIYTSIHLYIYTSIHLYIYTSIHLYIYTSIHQRLGKRQLPPAWTQWTGAYSMHTCIKPPILCYVTVLNPLYCAM
ncbi:hypothetical protein B484DRAFT_332087, partial [Ochromonadaceae sp. CCMP2298]